MADLIVVAILAAVIAAAVRSIYKAKKRGVKCIGCSAGGCSCHGGEGGCGSDCGVRCPGSRN